MYTRVYTSKHELIELAAQPFASGGEGAVYKVISASGDFQDTCVKIYLDDATKEKREERIKFMVRNPPEAISGEGYMLGWPIDYVTDEAGKFLGFMMPLGLPDSRELVALTSTTLNKNLSKEWHERYDRSLGKKATISRLKLINNIAIPIHLLHRTGKYVLKDFKPQNLLATADGRITICDMDSIQIAEGDKLLFPGTAATREYIPPECFNKGVGRNVSDIIQPSWDSFAMGTVFYQLLFGIHPYVVTPKTEQGGGSNDISHNISSGLFPFGANGDEVKVRPKLHDKFLILPEALQNLFLRTFSDDTGKRPTAEEWGKYIHDVVISSEKDEEADGENQSSGKPVIAGLMEAQGTQDGTSSIDDKNRTSETQNVASSTNGIGLGSSEYGKTKSGKSQNGKTLLWCLSAILSLLFLLFLVLYISANNENKELQDEITSLKYNADNVVQNKDDEIDQLRNSLNTLKSDITSVAPFVINRVEIGNAYKDGDMETNYGSTIYTNRTMYLKPKVYYKGFSSGSYNLKTKWFYPDGSLSTGTDSPDGFSQEKEYTFSEGDNSKELVGWGNESMGHWRSGDYRLEIWYKDKCVYLKNFKVYE